MICISQSIGGDSSHFGNSIAIQAVVEVPFLFMFSYLLKKTSAASLMGIAAVGYVIKGWWYISADSILSIYLVQFTQIFTFTSLLQLLFTTLFMQLKRMIR